MKVGQRSARVWKDQDLELVGRAGRVRGGYDSACGLRRDAHRCAE